ncbi:MAG: hypothetical protein ACK4N1_12870, partial [Pseudorhizobium sp.]
MVHDFMTRQHLADPDAANHSSESGGPCMMHKVTDAIYVDVPRDPRVQPDAALQALYRSHAQDTRRQTTRQGLWIAVLVYVLFSISDILLISDVARFTVTTRFAISAIMLLGMEFQVRRGGSA